MGASRGAHFPFHDVVASLPCLKFVHMLAEMRKVLVH